MSVCIEMAGRNSAQSLKQTQQSSLMLTVADYSMHVHMPYNFIEHIQHCINGIWPTFTDSGNSYSYGHPVVPSRPGMRGSKCTVLIAMKQII